MDEEREIDTRARIILTAERLFGEHGIDGVSLRQIRLQAGQSNNSAVHYHFRDRADLVHAILAYRVGQMETRRRKMLDDVFANGQEANLRALLEVMCLPQLELTDDTGRYPYVRFTSEYLTRYRATGIMHPGDSSTNAPAVAELMELFYSALFMFERDIVLLRLTGAVLIFLNLISQYDCGQKFNGTRFDLPTVTDEALTLATAALAAPASRALKERYQKS